MALSAFTLLCDRHQPEAVRPVGSTSPQPPSRSPRQSSFRFVSGFHCSGCLTEVESHSIRLFVTGLFPLASSGFVCVAARIGIAFLFKVKNTAVHVHVLFGSSVHHWRTPGHLRCFCLLAVVSHAAVSMVSKPRLESPLAVLPRISPEVRLLDRQWLVFKVNPFF